MAPAAIVAEAIVASAGARSSGVALTTYCNSMPVLTHGSSQSNVTECNEVVMLCNTGASGTAEFEAPASVRLTLMTIGAGATSSARAKSSLLGTPI